MTKLRQNTKIPGLHAAFGKAPSKRKRYPTQYFLLIVHMNSGKNLLRLLVRGSRKTIIEHVNTSGLDQFDWTQNAEHYAYNTSLQNAVAPVLGALINTLYTADLGGEGKLTA